MDSKLYYKLLEQIQDQQFIFSIGGRTVSKIDFFGVYFCHSLEYYLGGFVEYSKHDDYIEIRVKNDDIGIGVFTLTNDTIKYENPAAIFTRLLEEYDGLMRYRYRDYEKENEHV